MIVVSSSLRGFHATTDDSHQRIFPKTMFMFIIIVKISLCVCLCVCNRMEPYEFSCTFLYFERSTSSLLVFDQRRRKKQFLRLWTIDGKDKTATQSISLRFNLFSQFTFSCFVRFVGATSSQATQHDTVAAPAVCWARRRNHSISRNQ